MKTPREILLQRHESAGDKLDTVRENALATAFPRASVKPSLPIRVAFKFWQELIWPSRRIWAGIAAAWVVIVIVNLYAASNTEMASHNFTPPSPAVLMALREQERWLVEFAEPREARDADRPQKTAPLPRSEWHGELLQA
jgi:hypothetical protein